MAEKISFEHKIRFGNIKKELTAFGPKEGNFLKVELLFFDAIDIAKQYGHDIELNYLLASLKELQYSTYKHTSDHFKNCSQREHVIKRFMSQFKAVLSIAIKNADAKVEEL